MKYLKVIHSCRYVIYTHLNMIDKRIITGIALLIGLAIAVYFVYFHKGSAEDLLAKNIKTRSIPNKLQESSYDYDNYESDDPAIQSVREWQHWLDMMNYVSIGELYNKCDGEDRIMIGKVIMVPDKKNGGVMSQTFTNITLEKEVTGGEMFIEIQYNGKDLFSNHWDLCTVEETMGMETKIIYCPTLPGRKKYLKEMDIPNFLPKGRYSIKAWMTDQDDELLGCAYSDFTL